MRRFVKLFMASTVMAGLLLTGCGNQGEKAQDPSTESKGAETQAVLSLTKDNPIKVDKEAGKVTFLAKVNGKYFFEPTRHAAVFEGGSNGDKSVFTGLVDTEPFHNALVEIGAQAGENMTPDNKETTKVQGDSLAVSVTWGDGSKEYDLNEVVKDSNGSKIDIRFGGNLKRALDKKTGCLICLDSCPVGITSNAAYTYGAVEKRDEVGFTGNQDILPEDGSLVAITVKLNK